MRIVVVTIITVVVTGGTIVILNITKVVLKILQAQLQQYFQMHKIDSEKAEQPEIKLSTSAGS